MPPIAALIAGIAAVGAGAAGGLGVTLFGASFFLSSGTLFELGAALILTGASQLINKQSNPNNLNTSLRNQLSKSSIAPTQVIYGRAGQVGGVVTYVGTVDNDQTVLLVITFTKHQIQSFDNVYFDGTLISLDANGSIVNSPYPSIYAGNGAIWFNLGGDGQEAFPELISADPAHWNAACRQAGCASMFVKLNYNAAVYPNGVPKISVDIHGKNDIYDPRTGGTGYTNNAALCLRDYLVNPRWGPGVTAAEIDDAQTIAAANICDELVPLNAPADRLGPLGDAEPRYACDGVFTTDASPQTIIQGMLSAMAGRLVFRGGIFGIFPGAYVTPTVSLDESDLCGPIEVQTSLQKSDLFNAVKGTFVSAASGWAPTDFPPYPPYGILGEPGNMPAPFLDYTPQDGGEIIWKDVQLPFTQSPATAQRLAKIDLVRDRHQLRVLLRCKLTAYQCQVLDTVQLSIARYGWVNKTFEVLAAQFRVDNAALGIDLTLQDTDADVYDWSPAEEQALSLPIQIGLGPELPNALPGNLQPALLPTNLSPPGATPQLVPAGEVFTLAQVSTEFIVPQDFAGTIVTSEVLPSAPVTLLIGTTTGTPGGLGTITVNPDGSVVMHTVLRGTVLLNGPPSNSVVIVAITPSPQDPTWAGVTIALNLIEGPAAA